MDRLEGGPFQASLFDVSDITESQFFEHAEAKVIEALRQYAEKSQNGHRLQRQLFTEDAVQGFAFVDLCQKRYDVVLMNPPFGETSTATSDYISQCYPSWNKNLLCSFLQRSLGFGPKRTFVGCIFDKTALVKSTYEEFRNAVVYPPTGALLLGDLGWGVLDDANVETALGVFSESEETIKILRMRDVPPDSKAHSILQVVEGNNSGEPQDKLVVHQKRIVGQFPNGSIPFDIEPWIVDLVGRCHKFECVIGKSCTGPQLKAEINFRLFWEISPFDEIGKGCYWSTLYNGSDFQRYSTQLRDITRYGCNGDAVPEHISTRWNNRREQQKPGIGWGKRGDYVDAHVMPSGTVFSVEGVGLPLTQNR